MNIYSIGAILGLLSWIFLAFVLALPTGWVHIPLVFAVVLVVIAIVHQSKQ